MKCSLKAEMAKPIIAVTMGDGAGIGPEIIVKALDDRTVQGRCRPVVIGDAKMLERAKSIVGVESAIRSVASIADIECRPGTIDCLDLDLLPMDLPFGLVSPLAGDAAFRYLERAISLAGDRQVDAICTAPLHKEALNAGGHAYPGHTEILAELTGTNGYAMMFWSPRLSVILVTIHVGILNALDMITPQRVHRTIVLADTALRRMGCESPRIAVCGINPHAGEGGLFGAGEEEAKVVPAVVRAGNEGIDAAGPMPADTLFHRAVHGDFDIVVAMFHDQGLGPIKTLGMETAVNITVGLPIIRTSVDHGTAFDIAGKGTADAGNMKAAILKAVDLAEGSAHCGPDTAADL